MKKDWNRIWKWAIMIVVIILADQFSKGMVQARFNLGESIDIIPGFFNFTYVRNPGAAFGLGASSGKTVRVVLFLILPVLVSLWLVWSIYHVRKQKNYLGLAYSLIFAGAVGNLIDRFSLGYVVDFLDFYIGRSHFPAFNIADSAITIAAFLLIYEQILEYKRNKKSKESKTA